MMGRLKAALVGIGFIALIAIFVVGVVLGVRLLSTHIPIWWILLALVTPFLIYLAHEIGEAILRRR